MQRTTLLFTGLAILLMCTGIVTACTPGEFNDPVNPSSDAGTATTNGTCADHANEALWSHGREVVLGSGGETLPSAEGVTEYLEIQEYCSDDTTNMDFTSNRDHLPRPISTHG